MIVTKNRTDIRKLLTDNSLILKDSEAFYSNSLEVYKKILSSVKNKRVKVQLLYYLEEVGFEGCSTFF